MPTCTKAACASGQSPGPPDRGFVYWSDGAPACMIVRVFSSMICNIPDITIIGIQNKKGMGRLTFFCCCFAR